MKKIMMKNKKKQKKIKKRKKKKIKIIKKRKKIMIVVIYQFQIKMKILQMSKLISKKLFKDLFQTTSYSKKAKN